MNPVASLEQSQRFEYFLSSLLSSLDEQVFFTQLSMAIKELLAEENVEIFRVHSDESAKAVAKNGHPILDATLWKKGESIAGYVAKMKRPYYSNNVKRDPLFTKLNNERMLQGIHIEAELVYPLSVDGYLLATIHLQSSQSQRQFSEKDFTRLREVLVGLQKATDNMHQFMMVKHVNQELMNKIEQGNSVRIMQNSATKDSSLAMNLSHASSNTEMASGENILGLDKNLLNAKKIAEKAAREEFPVLIEGALGTGKRLFAKHIHKLSQRSHAPIIIFECGVKDEHSFEQEFLGSVERPGAIELANGGTLVLSDIGEMPINLQAKLLNILTTGMITRNGGREKIATNVRYIATTKKSLMSLVLEKKFREDLLYRLNTVSILLPELQQRPEDMKILADYFLNHGKAEKKYLTSTVLQKLQSHHWSANILELRSIMERAHMMTDGQYIESLDLNTPAHTLAVEPKSEVLVAVNPDDEITLFELEKKHIIRSLERLNGNKTKAAKSLGITVKTLYNKLHAYGLFDESATSIME